MNRLQSELQRLYLLPSSDNGRLTGARGEVRAMVLELARPADWDTLAQVWRGVQADLQLPAPAIAVSGTDGLQLWFSLQDAVGATRAAAFLALLRARYLQGVAPARLRAMPSAGEPAWQAALVPSAAGGHGELVSLCRSRPGAGVCRHAPGWTSPLASTRAKRTCWPD